MALLAIHSDFFWGGRRHPPEAVGHLTGDSVRMSFFAFIWIDFELKAAIGFPSGAGRSSFRPSTPPRARGAGGEILCRSDGRKDERGDAGNFGNDLDFPSGVG